MRMTPEQETAMYDQPEDRTEYLTDLEDALRDDANVMRARSGSRVRLNLDDAADAVAELRALLEAS